MTWWIYYCLLADQIVWSDMGQKINVWDLEFESEQHACNWYNTYARGIEFSIRRQWKGKDGSGNISSRGFLCSNEGHRKIINKEDVKRVKKDTRCGCLVEFAIPRLPNGKFRTFEWKAQHNHDLVPKDYVHMLPSQRNIKELQANEVNRADDSGIRPKLTHEYLSNQVGGRENLGFTHQDLTNYLNSRRNQDLKHGEARGLLNYFLGQYEKNQQFFFRVQMDVQDQIMNIFGLIHL